VEGGGVFSVVEIGKEIARRLKSSRKTASFLKSNAIRIALLLFFLVRPHCHRPKLPACARACQSVKGASNSHRFKPPHAAPAATMLNMGNALRLPDPPR
jgi:hypothetical protein